MGHYFLNNLLVSGNEKGYSPWKNRGSGVSGDISTQNDSHNYIITLTNIRDIFQCTLKGEILLYSSQLATNEDVFIENMM